jgi:hypothetical protein
MERNRNPTHHPAVRCPSSWIRIEMKAATGNRIADCPLGVIIP